MDALTKIHTQIEAHRGTQLPPPIIRRALRISVGLSQADVARVVGVNRVSISRWESGDREPIEPFRSVYAEALDGMRGGQ